MMLAQVSNLSNVGFQLNSNYIQITGLQNASPNALAITAGALIVVGALQCFLGFRMFRFYLGVMGLLLGAAVGIYVAQQIQGAALTQTEMYIGMGVGGLVGMLLFSMLYIVGVFILGAGLGYAAAITIMQATGTTANVQAIGLAAAVGTGVITIFLRKFLIIVISSVIGAPWVVIGIAHFMNIRSLQAFSQPVTWSALYRQNQIMVFTMGGLAIGGILVQFLVTSPKKQTAANDDV